MIWLIRNNTITHIFAIMFKPVIASLFLLVFMVQTFNAPFILLDYMANTAAYAKKCINTSKPKLHCNGKCQMMKKMQEEERKDQQNSKQKSVNKIQVLSSGSFFSLLIIPARSSIKVRAYGSDFLTVDLSMAVFHPPQA